LYFVSLQDLEKKVNKETRFAFFVFIWSPMSNLSYGKAGDASLGTKKEIWAARSGEIREIPILLRERHLVPMVKKRFQEIWY